MWRAMGTGRVSLRVSGRTSWVQLSRKRFSGGIFACCKEALVMEVSGLESSGPNSFGRGIEMSMGVMNRLNLLLWIF